MKSKNVVERVRQACLAAAIAVLPACGGGQAPTLTAEQIDDVVAFLCTLTDGFDPKNPAAYDVPAQCRPIAATSAASHTEGTSK